MEFSIEIIQMSCDSYTEWRVLGLGRFVLVFFFNFDFVWFGFWFFLIVVTVVAATSGLSKIWNL